MSKEGAKSLGRALLYGALLTAAVAHADWNPRPSWKDSYSVGGRCYCDSNGYDHGLDRKSAITPVGEQNVVTVCDDIRTALGEGPAERRLHYNDIQCGNGPANDAADERGCPGRIDMGRAGCDVIGPKWDLTAVYGPWPDGSTGESIDADEGMIGSDADSDGNPASEAADDDSTIFESDDFSVYPSRENWLVTTSHNAANGHHMIDGDVESRWTSRTRQRAGLYVEIDLQSEITIDRVTLETNRSPNDSPRALEIALSTDGVDWQQVATGIGDSPLLRIDFSPTPARFVRVEQTGDDSRYWWSIHELYVKRATQLRPGEPSEPSRGSSTARHALDRTLWQLHASRGQPLAFNAIDGNPSTRWATRQSQRSGQVLDVDFQRVERFDRIEMMHSSHVFDFPRGYVVSVSDDYAVWHEVVRGIGTESTTAIDVGVQTARYLRIEQTGTAARNWWSIQELNLYRSGDAEPISISSVGRDGWLLYTSDSQEDASLAIDGDPSTRWTTRSRQRPGQYVEIDMQREASLDRIDLDTRGSRNDYPRGYLVSVSVDGSNWQEIATGTSANASTTFTMDGGLVRYIRIEQTGGHRRNWWSIHEINAFETISSP